MIEDDGNDPIVVKAHVGPAYVKRILVDGGSAVDILMYDCFKQMKIPDTELTPADPIYSFSNHPV